MSLILDWIQRWFALECDGEWEHSKGIIIDTLDNPGWRVRIDFRESGRAPDEVLLDDRSAVDWALCRVEEGVFHGYGGPHALERILTEFKRYVEGRRLTSS